MGNELIPSGDNQQSLTPYVSPSSTGSILSQAAGTANHQLEYLKGHEADVGRLFKLLLYGGGAIWFFFNWQLVRDFVSGVVDIQTKLIYGGALGLVMWLSWEVFSNKKFQYTIAMMIDRTIEKFHRAMVARDPEGSARFSINRLDKRIMEGEEAKGKVGQAGDTILRAANTAYNAAREAFAQAKGLMQEQQNRQQGRGNPRIKLTDVQLDLALAKSKADARREYAFWQEETANAQTLSARYAAIQEVLDAARVELDNMKADLEKAIARYQLNLQQMQAMEASDDVVHSQERSVFDQSMQIIAQQADAFDGRTRMILERLDPTIQSYRANQAGSTIADDEFFAALANDPSFGVKPETQQKLLAAPAKPVLDDMEQFLGGTTVPREKVPVRTARTASEGSSKASGNFDDLLGGGR